MRLPTDRVRQRGQSAVEFAVLCLAAALAFVAMFGFLRNALSHRFKTGADTFGYGLRYQGGQK